ncbi:MAG TPA: AAA family ATPase, partial [Pedobacter sp.]
MRRLFITGIGTDVGKTLIASILVEKLKADYWKPIQSGDLDNSDTMKVRSLVSNPVSVFHPEAYRLTQPFSPHKSAAIDGVEITLKNVSC